MKKRKRHRVEGDIREIEDYMCGGSIERDGTVGMRRRRREEEKSDMESAYNEVRVRHKGSRRDRASC